MSLVRRGWQAGPTNPINRAGTIGPANSRLARVLNAPLRLTVRHTPIAVERRITRGSVATSGHQVYVRGERTSLTSRSRQNAEPTAIQLANSEIPDVGANPPLAQTRWVVLGATPD